MSAAKKGYEGITNRKVLAGIASQEVGITSQLGLDCFARNALNFLCVLLTNKHFARNQTRTRDAMALQVLQDRPKTQRNL
jgi:hypothetical protein